MRCDIAIRVRRRIERRHVGLLFAGVWGWGRLLLCRQFVGFPEDFPALTREQTIEVLEYLKALLWGIKGKSRGL